MGEDVAIVLAVNPPLLSTALQRRLEAAGFRVVSATDPSGARVAVVSPDREPEVAGLGTDLVVRLPDEQGHGGSIVPRPRTSSEVVHEQEVELDSPDQLLVVLRELAGRPGGDSPAR